MTGIDFSGRSIRHAQETAIADGLTIRYVNQDYLEFSTTDRYDLILMIMCDFCALSPGQRRTMLEKFNALLKPDGSVLLDVFTLEAFAGRAEASEHGHRLMHGFWAPGEYWGFQDTFKYEEEKVVLDKYTIVEPQRTRCVYNWLQYFSLEALAAEFEACGLCIVEKYGDVGGGAYEDGDVVAVVAQKA